MARRFGSAMISKTDSTLLIYLTTHIRVKVYYATSKIADESSAPPGLGSYQNVVRDAQGGYSVGS